MGAQFFRRAQPGLPVRRPVRNSRAPRSSTVLLIGPRRHELAHPTSQTCAALRPPQPKKKQSFSSNCPKSFPEFLLQRLIQPLVINFLSHATSTLPVRTTLPNSSGGSLKTEPNHTKAGLKNGTTPERGQNGCHPRRDGHGLPLPTRRPLRRRRRRRCVFLGGVGLLRARLCLPDHPSAQGGPAPAAAKAAGANPVRRGRGRGRRRRAG